MAKLTKFETFLVAHRLRADFVGERVTVSRAVRVRWSVKLFTDAGYRLMQMSGPDRRTVEKRIMGAFYQAYPEGRIPA